MAQPVLVIINGRPASGKTTLANLLSATYHLPVISKDALKEELFDSLGWSDREWSRQVGKAASQLLYSLTETLISSGQSLIAESNFVPAFAEPVFQRVITQYHPHVVQILCVASPETIIARFQSRATSENRHKGHRDENNTDEITESLRSPFNPLRLSGQTVTLNTNSPDDIFYEEVYRALHNAGLIRDQSSAGSASTVYRRRQPWLSSPPRHLLTFGMPDRGDKK